MKGKGILIDNKFEVKIAGTKDGEGKIVEGMAIGNVLYQNQALILQLHAGSVKTRPQVGVGIADSLLDNDFLFWKRKIRQQMELDGQAVAGVIFSKNEKLEIDAKYGS